MELIGLDGSRRKNRAIRSPQHTWYTEFRPFDIQPTCIAPVLPGETLRNILWKARTVTDPIDNPLIGWWCEFYWFYVKCRDCQDDLTAIETMFLDPSNTLSALDGSASTIRYETATGPQWLNACYQRIVEEYFRLPGETWNTYTVSTGLVSAAISHTTWLDSVVTDTDFIANQVPDQTLTVGVDDEFTMKELSDKWELWQWQKRMGILGGEDLTFEEWLRGQGINVPFADDPENLHRPELIRYVKQWTYPSNTVDPTDGDPSSAVSWSTSERADKDRFFTEPGFVIGLTVVRPKVYLSTQSGYASQLLKTARDWVPEFLSSDPGYSYRQVAASTAPLANQTDAYWVDLKDLFLYGDQFVNVSLSSTDAGLVAIPTAALQKRYPASTDVDNLFATKTAGVGKVRQDGICDLRIASHIRETSAEV